MHVPTQNWVQRSDKRQADRSSQKSFQNPFNDQFLNILQLQVPPNWAKKKTVGRHCGGDLRPFCCACSHEWVLFGFKSYQWITFYISVNHLFFIAFSLPFSSFFVLLSNSFLKHSLLLASVTWFPADVLYFSDHSSPFPCQFLLLYLVFNRPQLSVLFILTLHGHPKSFHLLPCLWMHL